VAGKGIGVCSGDRVMVGTAVKVPGMTPGSNVADAVGDRTKGSVGGTAGSNGPGASTSMITPAQ
jgi:hypothetical protein